MSACRLLEFLIRHMLRNQARRNPFTKENGNEKVLKVRRLKSRKRINLRVTHAKEASEVGKRIS